MNKSTEIVLNTKEIDALYEDMTRALVLTMGILQDEIRDAQVIPRDTGALQGEKFYVDTSRVKEGIVSLVNEGPYARRLYYHPEYNFRTDKNPNAQGLWFSPWQRGGVYEKRPQEIFEGVLKQIIGGKL